MIVVKDGDTVFEDRQVVENLKRDDSVVVRFKGWTPKEDGNYKMEFYTGYLFGKFITDELVLDECSEDDYLRMDFSFSGVEEDGDQEGISFEVIANTEEYVGFRIETEERDYVDVSVYDGAGKKLTTLYRGMVSGSKRIAWKSKDKGVFFVRLRTSRKELKKKVVRF